MYSEYTKNRILALANANKTPTEIVIILKEENIVVVRTTVARIIRRARERKQGQQLQDGRGRPPKASSPVKRKIDEVYRRDPEVTASELKNVLENELGIRMGVSTIKRARKAAGWICTQTRYCQMVRDANKIKRLAIDNLTRKLRAQLKVKFFAFLGPPCLVRNRQNYGMAALLVLPANVKTFVMPGKRLWKLQKLLIAITYNCDVSVNY